MTILRDPGGERLFLEGRLEGVSVPDLIHAICLPGKTGLLTLSHGEITKTVYIQKGQLIFASSNQAEERLGETLLRSGVIGFSQLEEAVARLGGGKRLGAILVDLGHLDPANLVRGLLHQVKEIILSLFPWSTGAYRFAEGSLPTAEVITLNIATSKLISDGIRRITSWRRIARAVGSSRTAYRLTRDGWLLAAELDLGDAERAILTALEEPATVGQICHGVFLPNFDVYQYLWSFRILGIARQVDLDPDRRQEWAGQQERQGSLVELSLGELLLELAREEKTGVLTLTHEDEEKSIHLKEGVVSFATSSRTDESLTSFLLRRGVIALHDKEEIERRLLTNKRVGTLLLELGILSKEELDRFVREQLLEIVLSAFAWDMGEWRFSPGELPTIEAITLDRSIGDLILHGTRSIRSWSRIRAGCGDLDAILAPTATFEAALAGAEIGSDEKEILAAVTIPRTVGDICSSTQVSDFRAAQIVWALRILGVLERLESMPALAQAAPAPPSDAALGGDSSASKEAVAGMVSSAAGASIGGTQERSEGSSSIRVPIVAADDGAVQIHMDVAPHEQAGVRIPVVEAAGEAAPSAPAGESDEERSFRIPIEAAGEIGALSVPIGPATEGGSLRVSVEAAGDGDAPRIPIETAGEGNGPRIPIETAGEGDAPRIPIETAGASSAERPAATRVDAGERANAGPQAEAGIAESGPARTSTALSLDLPESAAKPAKAAKPSKTAKPAKTAAPSREALAELASEEAPTAVRASAAPPNLPAPSKSPEDAAPEIGREPQRPARASAEPFAEPAAGYPANPAGERARRTPLEAVGTGVLEEIERFNRRHREVYSVLKGAIGAGARNVVANCAKGLGEGAQLFAGLAMDATGAFPAELLFERVGTLTPAEIRGRLDALIDREARFSEGMLDAATVKNLHKRLETAGAEVAKATHP